MPVTPWPEPVPFTGRAAYAIAQTSYYASAVVGVGFVIGGAIAALIGVRELILPSDSETTREAVRSVLAGLAWAVPGLLFTWWHLREARNREGRLVAGVFWGRSL